MTSPFHMFAMSGDAVIGLIAVVIWIWLSIAGKRSKPSQKTQPPPLVPMPGDASSPKDELRKFFEDLEKGLNASPPAEGTEGMPAPVVPAAPPPPLPSRPAHRRAPRPTSRPVPIAPAKPVTVESLPVAAMAAAAEAMSDAPQVTRLAHVAFPDIRFAETTASAAATPTPVRPRLEILRSYDGLRNAIVAAEVLGTPVGLRR